MSCQPNLRLRDLARRIGWVSMSATASFVLLAASSPQCARTADIPLSPTATLSPSSDVADCVQSCAGEALAARTAERDRFRAAMEACQSDGCQQAEAAVHVGIMQEIAREERDCMTGCHDQGGATGGN